MSESTIETATEQGKLVHNEQVKLMANAIDRASTATLNAGVILPLGAVLLLPSVVRMADAIANAYVWLTIAYLLNRTAKRALRRLR